MTSPPLPSGDATFFDMVHDLLTEGKGPSEAERREQRRHEYQCVQLMAPYDGRTMPTQVDFRQFNCHDISPGGFSFYAAERPPYEQLIVALGAVPFKFLTARVMHVRETSGDSGPPLLVGCRFTSRFAD